MASNEVPAQRKRPKKRSCWRVILLPWLKRHLCTWNLFTQYMLYFVGICLYLLVGGLVFYLIEHANEEEELEYDRQERIRFTAELAETLNQTFEETEDLVEYIGTLCDQDTFIGELETIPRKWEYGPSVFFAMTVITTIGYGNLAPATSAGQALFCVYALFGIPLFIFFMAILGRALSDAWDRTIQRWIIRNNKSLKYMSFLLLLVLGFVVFLGIPAIVFATIDEWTYTTSLYFVAVTLTTVGFGDVLPMGPRNTFERGMYVIGIVGWLFLGLTFASVIFTKVSKFYEKADNAIAKRMVSGLGKRRRFHPCGCLRGEDCTAKVQAGLKTDEQDHVALADGEQTNELELDVMQLNDVEDSVVNKDIEDGVENLDPVKDGIEDDSIDPVTTNL